MIQNAEVGIVGERCFSPELVGIESFLLQQCLGHEPAVGKVVAGGGNGFVLKVAQSPQVGSVVSNDDGDAGRF